MAAVVNIIIASSISDDTKSNKPIATTVLRLILMGQDPEGYAKAWMALSGAIQPLKLEMVGIKRLIITGSEDQSSPPELGLKWAKELRTEGLVILENVGH